MKSGVIAEKKGKTLGVNNYFIIWDIFACSQGYSVHDNEYQGKAKRGQPMSCERSKSMLNEKVVN